MLFVTRYPLPGDVSDNYSGYIRSNCTLSPSTPNDILLDLFSYIYSYQNLFLVISILKS
jgi:hypothetical protein